MSVFSLAMKKLAFTDRARYYADPAFAQAPLAMLLDKGYAAARRWIERSGRDIRLEVDGGIKADNIRRVADAGADTFVAGSAIFGKPDYKGVIDQMRKALA